MEMEMEMEGRESKLRTVLSWADEVEKEEAEAEAAIAHQQVQEKQKPNPFGSARPREVVLQKREIHQQNMHPDLQSPPSLFIFRNGAQKEVPHIPAPSGSNAYRKESILPHFLSVFHHPESAIFDPPLRYPPKNIVAAGLFLRSHSFEAKKWQESSQHQNNPVQAERGGADSKRVILEDDRQHGTAYVGCKRKGLHGKPVENERSWKNKEVDRRRRRPTRPPLVEATENRLHQNESNQNKNGFQNQKLYNDTTQWVMKKHPIPGADQVNGNKSAEANHSFKMKQAWVRTIETKGMKS